MTGILDVKESPIDLRGRHRRRGGLPRFLFVLAVAASLGFTARAHATLQHTRGGTILLLGDSLSAGYGLPRGTSWVDLLRTRLHRLDPHLRLVNASVSGQTSSEGRARLPRLLARWHPFLVVLELGGNDGLRALPPSLLAANLRAMILRARSTGACVLLLGVRLPPNYGPIYTRRFADVYRRVATRLHVPWIPFFLSSVATHRRDMQADGLHPNARAQPLILQEVWPRLAPLLQPGAPCR